MSKRNPPQPFEIHKIRFRDCFSAPSLRHFSVRITGWVLTVGVHTISHVILATGVHKSEHFATIYKFLGKTKWEVDRVGFEVFRIMVETLMPDTVEYEAVVDNTLNSHMGKKISGACVQHDVDAPKTGNSGRITLKDRASAESAVGTRRQLFDFAGRHAALPAMAGHISTFKTGLIHKTGPLRKDPEQTHPYDESPYVCPVGHRHTLPIAPKLEETWEQL